MLFFQGIPLNICRPLLGKISFSPVEKVDRASTIIVDQRSLTKEMKDYVAVISPNADIDKKLKNSNVPIIYNVKSIDNLTEGDILEIFPNGLINVLYQVNSKHNILFVTSKCNSNCIMCPQPIDNSEGNLTELNLKLISLIDKSTQELALTGGEPTVVSNDLFRIILACKHFLPDTFLLLLTNARKFNDFEYTRFWSSLRHPHLTIGTALYGDNDLEHDFIVGSKGAFNETIKGILNLASFDNPIEIRTVIHNYTYRRLLRLSEFIYRNMTFVRHVAFMGLEIIWRARANIEQLWVEPREIIIPLEEAVHYLVQRGINVSIYNMPLCLLPERLWMFARQSISDWKQSYDLRCSACSVKERCSGMFDSGVDIYKKYLKPVS
jgi:His-Xaa-Ser system radical SAM maturase HxsC